VSAVSPADAQPGMVVLRKAARLLDIPEPTLRRLCASGDVPARKIGRGWRVKSAYIAEVTAYAPAEVTP
jgi:excisionase family DNA binding protein